MERAYSFDDIPVPIVFQARQSAIDRFMIRYVAYVEGHDYPNTETLRLCEEFLDFYTAPASAQMPNLDEAKRTYKRKLRELHPDKNMDKSPDEQARLTKEFIRLRNTGPPKAADGPVKEMKFAENHMFIQILSRAGFSVKRFKNEYVIIL